MKPALMILPLERWGEYISASQQRYLEELRIGIKGLLTEVIRLVAQVPEKIPPDQFPLHISYRYIPNDMSFSVQYGRWSRSELESVFLDMVIALYNITYTLFRKALAEQLAELHETGYVPSVEVNVEILTVLDDSLHLGVTFDYIPF